ncbi:MAG: hypothetical protein Edafosvirus20_15 [Edafosvirus sp.]|uniref:Uncharacterized protein n=1 Tax=Edafosvirus sp. TaxID=2487765 RepID=A0A3G4ZUP0_9VIRU|nr:MAG: hypothetical protein Edafosvirus20_15 [Edafosvirus sp.]
MHKVNISIFWRFNMNNVLFIFNQAKELAIKAGPNLSLDKLGVTEI